MLLIKGNQAPQFPLESECTLRCILLRCKLGLKDYGCMHNTCLIYKDIECAFLQMRPLSNDFLMVLRDLEFEPFRLSHPSDMPLQLIPCFLLVVVD